MVTYQNKFACTIEINEVDFVTPEKAWSFDHRQPSAIYWQVEIDDVQPVNLCSEFSDALDLEDDEPLLHNEIPSLPIDAELDAELVSAERIDTLKMKATRKYKKRAKPNVNGNSQWQRKTNVLVTQQNHIKINQNLTNGIEILLKCKNGCWDAHSINEADMKDKITAYVSLPTQYAKSDWLHQAVNSVAENHTYNLGLPTKHSVCSSCFYSYNGIPRSTFFDAKSQAENLGVRHKLRRTGSGKPKRYLDMVIQYLLTYAAINAEQMPHMEEIHLNAFSWLTVYNQIIRDVPPLATMSYSTFMKNRKEGCNHIKIRKYSEFAKCSTCSELRDEISKTLGIRRQELIEDYNIHIAWQEAEKKEKRKHILKCLRKGEKSYCLIDIDGMDKHKTSIGKRVEEDKDTNQAAKLGCGIEGAQVYFKGVMKTYAYTQYARFPNGSDGIMNVLLDCITRSGVGVDGAFPDTLYIYYDNCSRENKNKYMLGLLHCLIHMGCFKKIKLCFLPVGHTHDRVDRFFRIINRYIKFLNIMSLKDLWSGIKKCQLQDELRENSPPVECVHIGAQGCYSAAMAPYLEKDSKIAGITGPRCFIIKRGADGIVQHWYRNQLQTTKKSGIGGDNLWMPYNELPFQMFPHGFPPIEHLLSPTLVPYVPIDIDQLRESNEMWNRKAYIDEATYRDHNTLFLKFEAEDAMTCRECSAYRHTMAKHGRSANHDKAEAAVNSSLYHTAYTGMKKHLQEPNDNHGLFQSQLPWPHRHYYWNMALLQYSHHMLIAEIPRTQHQAELHTRVISQQVEGQHVHAVGKSAGKVPKKKITDSEGKMDPGDKNITGNMYAICRNDNKVKPWFVIFIESCVMKQIEAGPDVSSTSSDACAGLKPKVFKVKYREMASSAPDGEGPFLFRWAKWALDKNTKQFGIINEWSKIPRKTPPSAGMTQGFLREANFEVSPIKTAWAESLITWDKDVYKLLRKDHHIRGETKAYVEKILQRRANDNECIPPMPVEGLYCDGEYDEVLQESAAGSAGVKKSIKRKAKKWNDDDTETSSSSEESSDEVDDDETNVVSAINLKGPARRKFLLKQFVKETGVRKGKLYNDVWDWTLSEVGSRPTVEESKRGRKK